MEGDVCYSLCSPDGTRLEQSNARDRRRWPYQAPPHQCKEGSGSGARCLPSLGHGRIASFNSRGLEGLSNLPWLTSMAPFTNDGNMSLGLRSAELAAEIATVPFLRRQTCLPLPRALCHPGHQVTTRSQAART